MFDNLEKYKSNGHFFVTEDDELKNVCNAPKSSIGIYIIYALKHGKIELVYIGSSGKIKQNGSKKVGIGGICDDLIPAHQFEDGRKLTLNDKISSDNIETLDIYWYVTFDKNNNDIPAFVLGIILQTFYDIHGRLPKWNVEY